MTQKMIDEIAVALNQGLYLVALSAALTLPDVCGKAEYPEERVSTRYKKWYSTFVPDGNLPEDSVYALRCSLLHEGNTNAKDKNDIKFQLMTNAYTQSIEIDFCITSKVTHANGTSEKRIIDIADYLNGLAMQKYRPTADETGIPVLKIKELRQGCCDDNSELCSPNIKSEYIIHDGDVIFSWSGSLLVDFWCGGICGLNQHLFKVTSSNYDKWFYYSWTKHHLDRFVAVAADKATTMGHIKRDELAKAEVLIPNEADYKRIRTLLQPIYDLIITNRIENKRLAKIRDILLPKLMSGELDVSAIQL